MKGANDIQYCTTFFAQFLCFKYMKNSKPYVTPTLVF